ncbi:hypothetical protein QJS10_CPB20g00301 [Acorus calamus]|uniref:Uncharacterized protein n=1 Tax=Acorus calamus TaxID=4465 RepID=A0AAV9CBY1_ACOCL|nr:hypothetical protein QJS10_CPB20g00301 [Acorus calamus]
MLTKEEKKRSKEVVMFAKRIFRKAVHHHQSNVDHGCMTGSDLDIRVADHYGIPHAASVLAFDPIQRLLAIGTMDGRIKVIGGDNIEGLLISPKRLPYKGLEFLQNQGFLIGVTNDNDIQVWDMEDRLVADCLQWENNITAFSVISGTHFIYIGDENGLVSVLKFDGEERKLLRSSYQISTNVVSVSAGISLPDHISIVGILPQPFTFGNRVLIAYDNGLIILWDVPEAQILILKGYTDLHLKNDAEVVQIGDDPLSNTSDNEQEEKEICSICWASTTGSVLAVGYIDGDILLWNISSSSTKGQHEEKPYNNVVKLQMSSAKRRLPVIVLHWSPDNKSKNNHGGQLFIYGGDEIGSEEVLTVLSLEWTSGLENFKCIARAELALHGSFADMILIPSAGSIGIDPTAALFVLTNPGQLHVYDGARLSVLRNHEKTPLHAEPFPVLVPTSEPLMTVTKFSSFSFHGMISNALSEMASANKQIGSPILSGGTKWPLTGGVPSELNMTEDGLKRLYIAGYQDGTVRLWDATYPVLSLILSTKGEVTGVNVGNGSASVSALDFCSISMILAVGNEGGLVHLYKFYDSSGETSFHFVNETKGEAHIMHHGKGFHCIATVSILKSPIRTIHFLSAGAKLAIGSETGQVAMIDMTSFSVLFCTDCIPGSSYPVISIITNTDTMTNTPKHPSSGNPKDCTEGVMFILTRNAHVVAIDSVSGDVISSQPLHPKKESTAISMHLIDGSIGVSEQQNIPQGSVLEKEVESSSCAESADENKTQNLKTRNHCDTALSENISPDSFLLLCCMDALRLYSMKSVLKGDNSCVRKVNLGKRCCWSGTFKRSEKLCSLILLYETGILEVRSLPHLEELGESSLMSILRWNFKPNMDKTMSSENGLITLVNGFEVAFISVMPSEKDFRNPESFPCLHDKVLAAAANAAVSFSTHQKKKESSGPGFLSGIVKGMKGKTGNAMNVGGILPGSNVTQLENIFFAPLSETSTLVSNDKEVGDLTIGTSSPPLPPPPPKKKNTVELTDDVYFVDDMKKLMIHYP